MRGQSHRTSELQREEKKHGRIWGLLIWDEFLQCKFSADAWTECVQTDFLIQLFLSAFFQLLTILSKNNDYCWDSWCWNSKSNAALWCQGLASGFGSEAFWGASLSCPLVAGARTMSQRWTSLIARSWEPSYCLWTNCTGMFCQVYFAIWGCLPILVPALFHLSPLTMVLFTLPFYDLSSLNWSLNPPE